MTIKLRTLIIIVVCLIALIGGGYEYYTTRIATLKNTIADEVKLKNALVDSVKTYRNFRNELVTEKLTLQSQIAQLNNKNNNLTSQQKELISRIQDMRLRGQIISAALVSTKTKLDSVINSKSLIDTTNKTVQFIDSTKYLKYDIKVKNVKPLSGKYTPMLSINSLELTNKQFIDFYWKNDRKNGYPVSFSVSNDNPYFKSANIDSYIIPQINEKELKPKFFRRVGLFIKKNKDYILVPGAVVVGLLLSHL